MGVDLSGVGIKSALTRVVNARRQCPGDHAGDDVQTRRQLSLGYGTVDLYLRAIARILSELSCASSAVRCKKSSVLNIAFSFTGNRADRRARICGSRAAFITLRPLRLIAGKECSSALIWPLLGSDGRNRIVPAAKT